MVCIVSACTPAAHPYHTPLLSPSGMASRWPRPSFPCRLGAKTYHEPVAAAGAASDDTADSSQTNGQADYTDQL